MKILIQDARILPMTGEGDEARGSIAIEDGVICQIGEVDTSFKADLVVDGSYHVALPGLINTHTHAAMQYFKNFNDAETNLQSWLQSVWSYEAVMSDEDIYWGSLSAIAEMIAGGTTCFNDMYFSVPETIRALQETHMKGTVGLTLFGDEQESRERIERSLHSLLNVKRESKGLIDLTIAPHAPYTCTDGTYRLAAEVARDHDLMVHTHLSESLFEVEESKKTLGESPVAHLNSLDSLHSNTLCAHVVHTDTHDVATLKKQNAAVLHNPSSNCKLSNGIAPIRRYMDEGIRVALGTDGSSSNNTLDMFREMRLAAMISASQGTPLSPYEIVEMATKTGAQVLGRLDTSGTLEVGKDADIILVDTRGIHTTPINNPYSALVFTLASCDVSSVFIRGKLVYHSKQFTEIDINTIREQLCLHWESMKQRVIRKRRST
ncbi:MAG: amidohydrolase [Sphaerochaetaceae bacterium]|nr:amidohydrolase [Sphaerochaetaceae bacterium]